MKNFKQLAQVHIMHSVTTVGPVQNLSVSLHVYKDSMPALYKLTFLLYLPLMYHYSTM